MRQIISRILSGRMSSGAVILVMNAAYIATASAATPMAPSSFQALHVFNRAGDGQAPMADVQVDSDGNLFGSAEFGGSNGFGAIFMLQLPATRKINWTEKVIFPFADGDDGGFPGSPLSFASNGNLTSSTLMGGSANHGTIFRLSPPVNANDSWAENALFNFLGANEGDGDGPLGPLLVQPNGTILGTSSFGGTCNCGSIFQLMVSS